MTRIRPLANRLVEAELLNVYREGLDTHVTSKQIVSRLASLRPSQLPFCPVHFFIQHANRGLFRSIDLLGSFYTSVGTSVHTTLQTHLGIIDRGGNSVFLADWFCQECSSWSRLSSKNICCDFPSQYHEVSVDYEFKSLPGSRVVGHIDAIYMDSAGKYWLVDYKTCSLAASAMKRANPGIVYVEQVETYALLLRLQHKIRVEGVILMFVPRDNPKTPVLWTKLLNNQDFMRIRERTKNYLAMHNEVMNISTLAEAIRLSRYGLCTNPYCPTCKTGFSNFKTLLKKAYGTGLRHKRVPLSNLLKT